ncbi:hypothetical protein ABEF93_003954 [Exophiala dermatitidis]
MTLKEAMDRMQPSLDLMPPMVTSALTDLSSSSLTAATWKRSTTSNSILRHPKSAGGALTDSQNRAILIAALTCSCFSFLVVLNALRIFMVQRRSFRHRLIMHLIMSNTLKAGLYFVFPIVVFANHTVQSSSNWCQASGFLLEFAVESADMSILIIALHSITYILWPNSKEGEGGLYPYRKWIYLLWLGPPLLAASLAFIKDGHGYVTAGTFCYLPKRPYWYRLALGWVPRYLIISVILAMYIWIYVYVRIKFHGFDNLGVTGSSHSSSSNDRRNSSIRPDDIEKNLAGSASRQMQLSNLRLPSWKAGASDKPPQQSTASDNLEPWDYMNFITSKPLQATVPEHGAEQQEGAPSAGPGSAWSSETRTPLGDPSIKVGASDSSKTESRKTSEAPAGSSFYPEPGVSTPMVVPKDVNDPLKETRNAIRKQLRYMFVYPAVYVVMWSFPFAQHVLYYNDYYVQHPVFWLNLVVSMMLSLQAGADGIIFSWAEKTRRREEEASLRCALQSAWDRVKTMFGRGAPDGEGRATQAVQRVSSSGQLNHQPPRTRHWWEAEGRRRRDSIWLGKSTFSDAMSSVTASRNRSRSPQRSDRALHSRKRSSIQAPVFVPTLEPISTEATEGTTHRSSPAPASAATGGMQPPTKKTALTPVSSNVSGRSRRRSSQVVHGIAEESPPPKASENS